MNTELTVFSSDLIPVYTTDNGSDGSPRTKNHTYWTQKGRLFIYDLLKSQGILPLIERGATA